MQWTRTGVRRKDMLLALHRALVLTGEGGEGGGERERGREGGRERRKEGGREGEGGKEGGGVSVGTSLSSCRHVSMEHSTVSDRDLRVAPRPKPPQL